jgi:acylphosphatase
MKKAILYISGDVQQSGFRAKIVDIAKALDIKGYVANLPDKRVKIIAEGDETDLERFIQAVNIKNTLINVTDLQKEYFTPTGEYESFFKLVGDGETDERLDTAADLLKELIHVSKNGFYNLGAKIDDLGARIDGLGDDLGAKIDGHGDDLGAKIDGLGDDLGARIDGLGDDLGARIDGLGDNLGARIDGLGDNLGARIDGLGDDLGGKIDQNRIEITSEIRSTRDDFKSNFEERIIMIEHDIAQIKAKIML